MNKQEFRDFLRDKVKTNMEFELVCNIIEYSQGMEKNDQFDFLWAMLEPLNIDNEILEKLEF